jgi:alkylation response protein AidB-like acyl-CoA dehydrogenase
MVTASRPAGGVWLLEAAAPGTVFTPERLDEEHRMIASSVRGVLAQEVAPLDVRLEAKDLALMRQVMRRLAALGIFAADVPEAYGGLGLDAMVGVALAETISRGSLSSTVGAHLTIGMLPIVFFGREAQRRRYLPRLASAEWIGAYALTEPTAGSDALSLRTTAEPDGEGGYRLSGTKQFITNGGLADVFVLYARLDGKVTCFIVERDTPGFAVGPEEHKMGLRGSSTTSLFLDGVRVPADRILGEPGRGHVVALNILNLGRLKLAAGCVGAAKHALRDAVRYARERRQFGRPIASFGLIQDMLAAMSARLFLAESAVYRTAGLLAAALGAVDHTGADRGRGAAQALEEYAAECAINKVYGSEMLDRVVDAAVQIYGGYGFIEDYPAARAYRDARINRLYEGTNEINRLVIAGQLLRRAGKGRLPLFDAARASAAALAAAAAAVAGAEPPAPDGGGDVETLVQRGKTVVLACAGRLLERLGPQPDEHQEVLGWLSDQIIEIFVLESGLLRARAQAASPWGAFMAALVEDAAEEAAEHLARAAGRILGSLAEGAALDRDAAAVRALLARRPSDVAARRRAIAARVIEAGEYPLGLPAG